MIRCETRIVIDIESSWNAIIIESCRNVIHHRIQYTGNKYSTCSMWSLCHMNKKWWTKLKRKMWWHKFKRPHTNICVYENGKWFQYKAYYLQWCSRNNERCVPFSHLICVLLSPLSSSSSIGHNGKIDRYYGSTLHMIFTFTRMCLPNS